MVEPEKKEEEESGKALVQVEGFEVERTLGEGHWGSLFLAKDLNKGRQVVLKHLMPPSEALSEKYAERLAAYRRMADMPGHPNMAKVYGVHPNDAGLPCVSMEFVPGISLGEFVKNSGTQGTVSVTRIAKAILSALAAVHPIDLLHGQLEPDRIWLGNDGTIRVLGFGLPLKVKDAAGSLLNRPTWPCYAGPEQFDDEAAVDRRADLYATAGIMFWLITRVTPHAAGGVPEGAKERIERALNIHHQISPEIRGMILKGLSTNPEHRFQNAVDFEAALGGDQAESYAPTDLMVSVDDNSTGNVQAAAPALDGGDDDDENFDNLSEAERAELQMALAEAEEEAAFKPTQLMPAAEDFSSPPAQTLSDREQQPDTSADNVIFEKESDETAEESTESSRGLLIGGIAAAAAALIGIFFVMQSMGGDKSGSPDTDVASAPAQSAPDIALPSQNRPQNSDVAESAIGAPEMASPTPSIDNAFDLAFSADTTEATDETEKINNPDSMTEDSSAPESEQSSEIEATPVDNAPPVSPLPEEEPAEIEVAEIEVAEVVAIPDEEPEAVVAFDTSLTDDSQASIREPDLGVIEADFSSDAEPVMVDSPETDPLERELLNDEAEEPEAIPALQDAPPVPVPVFPQSRLASGNRAPAAFPAQPAQDPKAPAVPKDDLTKKIAWPSSTLANKKIENINKPTYRTPTDRIGSLNRSRIGDIVVVEGRVANFTPPTSERAPHRTVLDDGTGRIHMVFWNDIAKLIHKEHQYKRGDTISAKGRIDIYREQLQLRILAPRDIYVVKKASPPTADSPKEIVPFGQFR